MLAAYSDIYSIGTSRIFHATEEIKPSVPIEQEKEEVLEEHSETLAGYTPKPDYKPKYTPKPEGESKSPSKYFGKIGEQTEVSKNCVMCKKEHMLWQCTEFKGLARSEKLKFIFTNKFCLHCLNPGHGYKSCAFFLERLCGIDGCDDKHH